MNGRPWPAADGALVWLPPGAQTVEPCSAEPSARILDFNGELGSAASVPGGIQFAYKTPARAIAVLDRKPVRQQIDTVEAPLAWIDSAGPFIVALPRGQHLVVLGFE